MKLKAIVFSTLSLFLICCGGGRLDESSDSDVETKDEENTVLDEVAADSVMEKNGIKVYESKMGKTFELAALELKSPEKQNLTHGDTVFVFKVDSFHLGTQTDDLKRPTLDNSESGQNIHVIINNQPYMAKYDTAFKVPLSEGENVVLAFLSRSYYESVKLDKANVLTKFTVGGESTEDTASVTYNLKDPMLFYSRPKGSYTGEGTKKILLDFYLKNVDLSTTGYKVKAIINGEEFVLTKWAPYFIEGLTLGENIVQLQLIDSLKNVVVPDGQKAPGIFQDSGKRSFILEQGGAKK